MSVYDRLLNRRNKFLGTITLIFIISQILITSSAYSPVYGIELGDEVTMSYVGTKENGEVFDENARATFTIDRDKLIPGFVDGMLGMKVGEKKKFSVPPSRGYQTGELAGITLYFDVRVISVKGYDPDATEEVDNSFSNSVIGWSVAILVIVFGSFGVMTVKNNFVPSLTKCITCGEPFEGTCASCNATYCRKDFGRRCKECNHKIFSPRKK